MRSSLRTFLAVSALSLGMLAPAVDASPSRNLLFPGGYHFEGLSLPLSGSVNEVWVGDSITFGYLSTGPYPSQVIAEQPGSFTSENEGVNGATTTSTINGTSPNATPLSLLLASTYNPAKNMNIMFSLLGVNDLCAALSPPSVVYDNLKKIWAIGHAGGYKVVAMTLISAGCAGNQITTLNALIRSNTKVYDLLIDLGADPVIGCVSCSGNIVYYNIDGVHPNAAGDAVIASDILAGIYYVPLSQVGNIFLGNGVDPLYLGNSTAGLCLSLGGC